MKKVISANDVAAFEGAANQAISMGAKAMEVDRRIIEHYQGPKYDRLFFNYKGLRVIEMGKIEELARQEKVTMEQLIHGG